MAVEWALLADIWAYDSSIPLCRGRGLSRLCLWLLLCLEAPGADTFMLVVLLAAVSCTYFLACADHSWQSRWEYSHTETPV